MALSMVFTRSWMKMRTTSPQLRKGNKTMKTMSILSANDLLQAECSRERNLVPVPSGRGFRILNRLIGRVQAEQQSETLSKHGEYEDIWTDSWSDDWDRSYD